MGPKKPRSSHFDRISRYLNVRFSKMECCFYHYLFQHFFWKTRKTEVSCVLNWKPQESKIVNNDVSFVFSFSSNPLFSNNVCSSFLFQSQCSGAASCDKNICSRSYREFFCFTTKILHLLEQLWSMDKQRAAFYEQKCSWLEKIARPKLQSNFCNHFFFIKKPKFWSFERADTI